MRTYGRIPVIDPNTGQQAIDPGTGLPQTRWVQVNPQNGFNDPIYITTLAQALKLNLGESPFYGNVGLPAKQSVVQQIAPDFYVMRTQQQFAGYFASLVIARTGAPLGYPANTPAYLVSVLTNQGYKINFTVAQAT